MTRLIAIDWDQGQGHLVSATIRGGNVEVQKALSWTEEPNGPAAPEQLGQKLRERMKEAGIAPAPVLACVGREHVVVKEVRFPTVPDPEEPAVVRFQTIKELADAPDDVVIDYYARALPGDSEKRATALVVRKKHLESLVKACAGAGLKLAGACPRMLGVSASLRKVMGTTVVTPAPVPADGAVCVVLTG
ncbi:MAG: hypothetical protein K2W96_20485, partial [Gemmataceae bacterium]|nr:hypothetical protein [Gemmataceae bacterium]